MKLKSVGLALMILSMGVNAEPTNKEKISSWYQSAKDTTEKALESGKKSAGKGLEVTAEFLNKTGKATKEGIKAFTDSYKKNSTKEDIAQHQNTVPAMSYLNIKGYKACIAIKNSSINKDVCLPKQRPLMCKESVFNQLKSIESPASC